jgi:hypothetical protein
LIYFKQLKLRNQVGSIYYQSWTNLDKVKEKAFQEGNFTSWDADFNAHGVERMDVINNKDVCKFLMFPKSNEELKNQQRIFGYLNVKMTDEAEHLFNARSKRTI